MRCLRRERRTGAGNGQLLARVAVFVVLALVLGACSATPISIPNGADGGLPARDAGAMADSAGRDLSLPDMGPTPNQDAPMGDAASDGLGDQQVEGGSGDGAVDGGGVDDGAADEGAADEGAADAGGADETSTSPDGTTSTGG